MSQNSYCLLAQATWGIMLPIPHTRMSFTVPTFPDWQNSRAFPRFYSHFSSIFFWTDNLTKYSKYYTQIHLAITNNICLNSSVFQYFVWFSLTFPLCSKFPDWKMPSHFPGFPVRVGTMSFCLCYRLHECDDWFWLECWMLDDQAQSLQTITLSQSIKQLVVQWHVWLFNPRDKIWWQIQETNNEQTKAKTVHVFDICVPDCERFHILW